MGDPASLADTVTPSSFCPDCDETAPDRIWSAPCAPSEKRMPAAPARTMVRAFFTGYSLNVRFDGSAIGRRGRWRRHRSHVGDDRVDLGRLKIVLECRHARRA